MCRTMRNLHVIQADQVFSTFSFLISPWLQGFPPFKLTENGP